MNKSTDSRGESEQDLGAQSSGVGVVGSSEIGKASGLDPVTVQLAYLGAAFEDVQRTRMAQVLRANAAEKSGNVSVAELAAVTAEGLKAVEDRLSRELKKTLTRHELYPWLSQYPGLAGPTTARLLGIIANPLMFPGVKCEAGHYWPETYGGEVCEVDWSLGDDPDGGLCLAPVHHRPGSGVRSLWHYLGLHAVDGKSPRLRKGQQGDWNPKGRTLVLMPDGIAAQIVKQRTPRYRDIYDEQKARLQRERGVAGDAADNDLEVGALRSASERGAEYLFENDSGDGPALSVVAEGVGMPLADGTSRGPLRPIQIEGIARKVAAKRFVGDLLIEWKRIAKEVAA